MWPAFPASDYYGSSAPSRRHQPTTDLPAHTTEEEWVRDRRDGSHVHRMTARPGRRPAMPLPLRHDYAAGIHRGLPTGDINRPKEFPAHPRRVRTAAQPTSARLEPVESIEGLSTAGFSRTPSELTCRTRAVWQYRPVPSLSGLLSTLTAVSQVRLPPACSHLLRQAGREGISPPHGHAAPRGARSPRPRVGSEHPL